MGHKLNPMLPSHEDLLLNLSPPKIFEEQARNIPGENLKTFCFVQ